MSFFRPRKKFSRTIPAIWRPFPTPGPCSASDKMVCALRRLPYVSILQRMTAYSATRWCVPSGGAGSLACEEAGFGIRDLGVGLLHLLGCCLLCQFTHAFSLHLVDIFCNFSLLTHIVHTFTHWHTSASVSIRHSIRHNLPETKYDATCSLTSAYVSIRHNLMPPARLS
jgi:hypothetical protein